MADPALPRRRRRRTAAAGDPARVFAALGEPARLRIVSRLCDAGPLSIARLTEGARVSRQAVTKHLHALEQAGLVQGGRAGREQIWALRPERLGDAQRYLDRISQQWDEALQRLQAFVEDDGPA
ncbi:MAG: ArsR/SmtB family transcription factor [Sinimarinibacterium flocculans]|uniref:ArsR family transcriptional regulator n=1 Tax=Sinimarinibacterium flocculans TaxID=985250 RepID=A0A318EDA3_9GAMM|nr:metalloregulator ArsR/SmtB family transcription factor [Sinimarinibacterium flocculans]MEC9363083.1 metalloregulator ArsR/SmtB family transcription factor [Pseudomonadota bacterium]PXV70547.1 ArsR family transcriptional regulator [Sinimarinibacterium flocculans]